MTAYGVDEFSTGITFSLVAISLFHAITYVSFCSDISLSRSFPQILAHLAISGLFSFFRNIRVPAFRHYIERDWRLLGLESHGYSGFFPRKWKRRNSG